MKKLILRKMHIQMLAEGTGGEAAAAAEGAEGEQQQEAAAEAEEPEDLEAEFDKLVRGEGKFREIYGKRVQKAAMERNRGMRQSVDRLNAFSPGIEILAARYGTTPDDPNLPQLIAQDKGLLEDQALKNGRDTETEMELARARAQTAKAVNMINQMQAQRDAELWQQQAAQIEKDYPNLQVGTALKDPEFTKLLRPPYNLDLKTAYMAKYGDRMIEEASRKATKKVTDSVAAGRNRPRENGAGASAGAATAIDPMKMSSEEFKRYSDAVMRGERVDFSR